MTLITAHSQVPALNDPRYGRVFEVSGPATGLTAVSLALAEVDPGKTLPAHYHRRTSEVYHVLSGAGTMVLNGQPHPARAGDTISLPPLTVHSFINPGPEPVRLVVATSPAYDLADDIET